MWHKFLANLIALANKLRPSLRRDRVVLLICMGIALLFWLFVKLSKPYLAERTVRLEYKVPLGFQFMDVPPSSLAVTFSGTGWDLLASYLARRRPLVSFELEAIPRQEIQRPELISKIEEKTAIKVQDLSRNYLLLVLDSTAMKKVPVVLDGHIHFSTDFGYRDAVQIVPDSITVFGSAALLHNVNVLLTESLVLNNLEVDARRTLSLVNPHPDLLRFSAQTVHVYIPVEQFTEKSFTVPILSVGTKDSVNISPQFVEVKCVAGLSRYDELDGSDFVVEANFENVYNLKEQNTVPLTLSRHPDWLRSVDFFPKAVEYLIIQ